MKTFQAGLFAFLFSAISVPAADFKFVRPGIPSVYPGDKLIIPTHYALIPRSKPVIRDGVPGVYPGDKLFRPTKLPLVASSVPNDLPPSR